MQRMLLQRYVNAVVRRGGSGPDIGSACCVIDAKMANFSMVSVLPFWIVISSTSKAMAGARYLTARLPY
ncbi:hypothetical protein DXT74_08025 [Chromobacterium sp. Rain0013]|nr:hypothetical protein DXT74_08025 [Chromobacterium sp. Rain0013]